MLHLENNSQMQGYTWSEVAKRGNSDKVPSSRMRQTKSKHAPPSSKTEIVFEIPGYSDKVRSQKAANILRRALNPDAILFEFANVSVPSDLLVEEIVEQLGEIEGFTDLNLYQRRTNNTILEIVFEKEESQRKAITTGVTIDNIVYLGTPWTDEARRKTVKVNLAHIPFKMNKTLDTVLKQAMEPYGEVMQIRKYVNMNDRFYGEASVILDRGDETMSLYEDLSRFIYIEATETCIPATYQGGPKICYHCRSVGHERRNCPELASLQCFKCKGFGHLRRHCKFEKDENLHEEDMRHYQQAESAAMEEDLQSIYTDQQEEDFEEEDNVLEPTVPKTSDVAITGQEETPASQIIPSSPEVTTGSDSSMEMEITEGRNAEEMQNKLEEVITNSKEAIALSTGKIATALKRKHEKTTATGKVSVGRPKTADVSRTSQPYNRPTESSTNHAHTLPHD